MGTIYKRTPAGAYYGYWTDQRGIAHRQSLRTKDVVVAKARLRELELVSTNRAAHTRETLTSAAGALLDTVEMTNAKATWSFYRTKARHLVRVLGDITLAEITRDRLTAYITQRRAEGASKSTVAKELIALRRTLKLAKERGTWVGDLAVIPAFRPAYKPIERWLDAHQAAQLLERLRPDRRLWVALAIFAGLRKSEIEGLRWEDIRWADGVIHVRGTKTVKSDRRVPIATELAHALMQVRRTTGLVVGKWLQSTRDLAVACAAAKVPRITANDLRRTFLSWLAQKGTHPRIAADLAGHASTRMVDLVYTRFPTTSYRAAVDKLPVLSNAAACAAGEKNNLPFPVFSEIQTPLGEESKSSETQEKVVPGAGIEPAARGFSVRRETIAKRALKQRVRSR